MKSFEINGKKYKAREIDFNFLCDLEDEGVSLADMEKKPMSTARAYFATCFNGTAEAAGKELEAHLKNGGNLNSLMNAFGDAISKSDFFQSMMKKGIQESEEE